jgi:hypothetical protein
MSSGPGLFIQYCIQTLDPSLCATFQLALRPGTPGLSVAFSSSGRLSLCSTLRVLPLGASTLRRTPALPTDRSRPLATTFPSPATTVPFGDPRGGVNVPGLLLRSPSGSTASPFGLWAPSPTHRLTPAWSRSLPAARCRLLDPAAPNPPPVFAPLRGSHPSGSQRSTGFASDELTPPRSPVSLRSPPALLFITCATGSPFQVRYLS